MTDECYSCKISLSRYEKKLCGNCSFSSSVSIFKSEVKQLYKLTDDDLDDADLFSIHPIIHRNVTTKYLIKEVEEFVSNFTKDLPDDDKRKIAYLKYKQEKNIQEEKEKIFHQREKSIKEYVKLLVSRYNVTLKDDYNNKIKEIIKSFS